MNRLIRELKWTWSRRDEYLRVLRTSFGSHHLLHYLLLHFPELYPNRNNPPMITLEISTKCNLACPYCTMHTEKRPHSFMSEEVFERFLKLASDAKLKHVRLVGNGEATVHPRFPEYIRRLANCIPIVELKTNGSLLKGEILEAVIDAPVNRIGISVDGITSSDFARLRKGTTLETVQTNLLKLRERRDQESLNMLIIVNAMLRPSLESRMDEIRDFWLPYADAFLFSPLQDFTNLDPDVYPRVLNEGTLPECKEVLKGFTVLCDGKVVTCTFAPPESAEDYYAGDIMATDLLTLWNRDPIRQYRRGLLKRNPELTPMCLKCSGGCRISTQDDS